MNKGISLCLVILLCLPVLAGCALQIEEPMATLAPGITKPEGGIVSTNPKVVEGRILKLEKDEITLEVQGVKWNMDLTEEAQKMLKRYDELGIEIRKGTFVMAYYREDLDRDREVTRIERVESN
ncbi:MAG: hypothetical protein E7418_05505 [Ruminococcaceae bacterium]|nr:hypothetical protein [Oscillospiraceae bacterium]